MSEIGRFLSTTGCLSILRSILRFNYKRILRTTILLQTVLFVDIKIN